MITIPCHHQIFQALSHPQEPCSPDFPFASPCASPRVDSLLAPSIDKSSMFPFGHDPPLSTISPVPKLRPLPNPHQFSDGVSEVSELFKTTSLEQECKDGQFTRSTSLMPSRNHDPSTDLFSVFSHPIHLRHLSEERPFSREITPSFSLVPTPPPGHPYNTEAHLHSAKFRRGHRLNHRFVELYQLQDELGSGGYGFVMTARHRLSGQEVAVKFIIKEKVPEHAWMEDELLGRLPTEVVLLNSIFHPNIVKFLDLFEDKLYFYLVQELHGTPWQKREGNSRVDSIVSTPSLSPSASERSFDSFEPRTPPPLVSSCLINPDAHASTISNSLHPLYAKAATNVFNYETPDISRRASHDLFECIEQSEDKRLPEAQARYVFTQIVDVVHYLNELGVAHRDIKDENIVIDESLKVKLIDFGSACAVDPKQPRPYYTQFFGTAAYASSEILLKKKYQAAPAEVWTLGVLLSYLLTGASPFPSVRDAADGRVMISELPGTTLSKDAIDLMHRCLDSSPEARITIQQIREHPWLVSPVV